MLDNAVGFNTSPPVFIPPSPRKYVPYTTVFYSFFLFFIFEVRVIKKRKNALTRPKLIRIFLLIVVNFDWFLESCSIFGYVFRLFLSRLRFPSLLVGKAEPNEVW